MSNNIRKLANRWYVRYLTTTELYMVEPWERVVIHVLFVLIFSLFWYFNYSIILNGILKMLGSRRHAEIL
ncbi:serine palmitoyltransferase small subunit A [Battus philenor]|uniref:serine palmitoyltransferase small subunit A n=1 Tax=Battus philenor TaxID=42288 RepID=UPI0035D0B98B